MSDSQKSARDAATESLIFNVVGMLVFVGVSLLLARRDWLARQAMMVRAAIRREGRKHRDERDVAEFRRRVSDY